MIIKFKFKRKISIGWGEWDFGRYFYSTSTIYSIGWLLITVEREFDDTN